MKVITLVNPGIEKLCQQEVKEILKAKATADEQVIQFTAKDINSLFIFVSRSQTARRILVSLGNYKNLDTLDFSKLDFLWKHFFPPAFSFKVEVENVKGMDNRIEIAQKVASQLFPFLEKSQLLHPALELKKPDFLIVVYKTDTDYYLGLDLAGEELNTRQYRLFTHQASMKGDLAYFFVRTSGYKSGEKLLLGFVKDGTMAIEAAFFTHALPIHTAQHQSFLKFPCYTSDLILKKDVSPKDTLFAFDDRYPNIVASRKNAALAGVSPLISFQKYELDELDTRFDEGQFDRAIFHVTAKDEVKLNEIFYQAHYILKKKGVFMLVSFKDLGIDTSDKFMLKNQGTITRGDSTYRWWILEKK